MSRASQLLTLAAIFLGVSAGFAGARSGSDDMIVCHQTYALCTSAPCVPMPGDPTKAVCSCAVEEGVSLGTKRCEELAPRTDANGVQTVYSTYSFAQYSQGKKILTCPGGTPWTLCLNKVCTVDPADPTKAVCTCDVKRTDSAWVTLGGDCDTNKCPNQYWSGASFDLVNDASAFLAKTLKLAKNPESWCPAAK